MKNYAQQTKIYLNIYDSKLNTLKRSSVGPGNFGVGKFRATD